VQFGVRPENLRLGGDAFEIESRMVDRWSRSLIHAGSGNSR